VFSKPVMPWVRQLSHPKNKVHIDVAEQQYRWLRHALTGLPAVYCSIEIRSEINGMHIVVFDHRYIHLIGHVG
jgi:hypothetical protein